MATYMITCECGQRMKVPGNLVGKSSKCVRCGTVLDITQEKLQPIDSQPPAEPSADQEASPASGPSGTVKRIGELLVEDGLITSEQLQEALQVQSERAGKTLQILLSLNYLDKDALHDFLSRQSGVAGIELASYRIPRELVNLVPKEIAQQNLVLPIDKLGKLLTVGMACPLDQDTIAELQSVTGLRVKPMLCRLDDILSTIETYYPREEEDETNYGFPEGADSGVTSPGKDQEEAAEAHGAVAVSEQSVRAVPERSRNDLQAMIVQLESLPAAIDTVQHVRQAVENTQSDLRDVAEAVGIDPPVTARLVGIANLPLYGVANRVTDIFLASILLGIDGVCEIVMSFKIHGAVNSGEADTAQHAYRANSLFCASAARAIAQLHNQALAPTAYTAGLLHDIGEMVLRECLGQDYPVLDRTLKGGDLLAAERNAVGTTRVEAGRVLAEEWGLPEDLCAVIGAGYTPGENGGNGLGEIISLAALMTDIYDIQKHVEGDAALEACKPLMQRLKDEVDALGLGGNAPVIISQQAASEVAIRLGD